MAFKMKGPWLKSFLKQKDYEKEGYGDLALIEGANPSASYADPVTPDWSGVGEALSDAIVNAGVFAASDEGHLKRDKRKAKRLGVDPTEFVEEEGFEFSENEEPTPPSKDPKKRFEELEKDIELSERKG
tara:strand:- start:1634 stop:2020 length:387 start_codon:yes stop_codon:yes gene_type:complete